jgi:UDP-3-O-[3-hydroxymyristoyl] glucosamine N-acyltransferase
LGNKVEVQPTTTIGTAGYGYAHDAEGNHHHIPHYGKVILHDEVQIGAGVNIDRGVFDNTVIGRGTKIDNHCHFAHNLQVGEKCLITAGFIVAGSTKIGNNYVTGGRVSMSGHIEIADNVQTGAMTVVTKSLEQPGNYAGFPMQDHREALKTQISLIALPSMRKDLKDLKRRLGGLESATEGLQGLLKGKSPP